MPDLVRARRGGSAHRPDCPVVGANSTPWEWAKSKTPGQIRANAKRLGVKICQVCKPLMEDDNA